MKGKVPWGRQFVNPDGRWICLFSGLFLTPLDKEGVICPSTVTMKEEPSGNWKMMSALPKEDSSNSLEPCTKMTMQLRKNQSNTQFVRTLNTVYELSGRGGS